MRLLSEEMNPLEKETLQNCRNLFLEDLDPSMSFLSQLYCARIITEDQKDRVESKGTRQDKVITLLEILPRRGPRAFRNFLGVLETDYGWIKEQLEEELQTQEYQKRILDAIEDRMKQNGEFIRDKDYINKIVKETVLPIVLQEVKSLPAGSPSTNSNQPLKDLITNHLLPLVGVSQSKNRSEVQDFSLERMIELIQELKEKSCLSLGIPDESSSEKSLPFLIDQRLSEMKAEIALLRKENKKSKKAEDKLSAENSKLKSDNTNLKADVKKYKSDCQGSKNEMKKLKDEVQKLKADSTKFKQENNVLKAALDDAGLDLRISSDFCGN